MDDVPWQLQLGSDCRPDLKLELQSFPATLRCANLVVLPIQCSNKTDLVLGCPS